MNVAKAIESFRSKSNSNWSKGLLFSLVLSTFLSVPAWAQSFEALGRWDSTYGRVALKYIGTKLDGTELISGRFLYDKKKRRIGVINNGEFNRKTGVLWFEYSEPWGGGDKGRANFKLSKDKSKFVGTFASRSGLKGPWVLTRPVAQSMIVYVPGKTQIVDFDNDDVFINMFGGDTKIIVVGERDVLKLPAGVKLVMAGGNDAAKAAAPGGGVNLVVNIGGKGAKNAPAGDAAAAAAAAKNAADAAAAAKNAAAAAAAAKNAADAAAAAKKAADAAAAANNAAAAAAAKNAAAAANKGKLKSEDLGGEDVTIFVKNDSGGPVRANWVDPDGKEGKSDDIIAPGEDKELGITHPGHVYRVRDAKTNQLLKEVRVPKGKNSVRVEVPAKL